MKQAGLVRNAAYLIRPDGYIGVADAGGSAAAISAYLSEKTRDRYEYSACLHQISGRQPTVCGPGIFQRSFAQTPASASGDGLIARAGDALDVFDFEPVAHRNIPPAHWGYLVSGVDGEDTLKANRAAYSHYQLQARRMIDVSKIDLSVELFGEKFNSPISSLSARRAKSLSSGRGNRGCQGREGQRPPADSLDGHVHRR